MTRYLPPTPQPVPDAQGRTWIEGPGIDELAEKAVDELQCRRCGAQIGWWVDADDTGRTIGGFIPFGRSADLLRRWCEDCFPGETWPQELTTVEKV